MISLAIERCFGLFYPARGKTGVIICPPFGQEALSSWHGLHDLAKLLADYGFPTLRLHYDGHGDSLGQDIDPDRLATWKGNIAAAIERMKDIGIERLALAGLRLGGTLAIEVAQERNDIAAVVALAPVVSGRGYLRELTLRNSTPREDGGMDFNGFAMTAQTLADIKAIDLRKSAAPNAQLLIAGGEHARDIAALASEWKAATTVFPDYETTFHDPIFAKLSTHLFEATRAFLRPLALPGTVTTPIRGELETDDFIEEGFSFGPDGKLFGILTRAKNADRSNPVVICYNPGANARIGWARNSVHFARRLAKSGIHSFRFDLSGFGDSQIIADAPDGPYDLSHMEDSRAAVDALEARGFGRICAYGPCSGGFQAFHIQTSDPRIEKAILVNTQRFVWRSDDTLEKAYNGAFKASTAYVSYLGQKEKWLHLLRNPGKLPGIAASIARKTAEAGRNRAQSWLGPIGLYADAPVNVIRRKAMHLGQRGQRLYFIFAKEDAGIDELNAFFGPGGSQLVKNGLAKVDYISSMDHNITQRQHIDLIADKATVFFLQPEIKTRKAA